MHLVEESAIARGMIRVEPGDDLVAALEVLAFAAGWREAYITGTGVLDLVELATGDSTLALERAEILSLSGRVKRGEARAEARLQAQVMVDGRLHAGRLVAGLAGDLLLVVDAALERPSKAAATPNEARGVRAAVPVASEPPPPRASSPGFVGGFGPKPAVVPIGRTEASLDSAEEEYWTEVGPGDVLEHPQLGTCEVVGEDESGGVRARIASGRICVLRLDTLEIAAPSTDAEGRLVYRIVGPKRRR